MPAAAESLERALSTALDRPVEVRFGDARRTVVRAQQRGQVLVVRLNAFFSEAPDEVQAALGTWLRSGRRAPRACRVLDEWIDERLARLHREEPRRVSLRTAGRHHDLAPLYADLHSREFAGVFAPEERPGLTWGRSGRSRSRRTLRLGSYDHHARLIRIHVALDQPAVPDWFVRFVLFHELLHAELDGDPAASGSPSRHHGPEFRRRERSHPDYRRAIDWEHRHVQALIRSARTGRPVPAARARIPVFAAAARSVQHLLFD